MSLGEFVVGVVVAVGGILIAITYGQMSGAW
jgi:hypothetical protein